MLRYMLLLCCLYAASAEAIKSKREIQQNKMLICLAKDTESGLFSLLDAEHQPYRKIIKIHNMARALSTIQRPYAYKQWRKTNLSEQFYTMFESRLSMKHFKPFLEQLIKHSGDIQTEYYGVPTQNLKQKLLENTEKAIDNVPDILTQTYLQNKLNRINPIK